MSQLFVCPNCQRQLRAKEEYVGKRVLCPGCQQPFLLDAPATSPVSPVAEPPAAAPPAPAPPPSRYAWLDYAREARIRLKEQRLATVPDLQRAEKELARLKQEMPEVASAYVPSGALPAAAVGFLSLGGLVGVPAGALAGIITAAVGALALAITFGVIGLIAAICNVVCCITILVAVVVVLCAYLFTFAITGMAAGACVASFGKFGKNRNVPVPMLLSALSAAAATGLFWIAWQMYGAHALEEVFEMKPGDLDLVYLISLLVGAIIAMIAGAMMARELVHGMKFCEECEQFMDEFALPQLRQGGLRAQARALNEGEITIAAGLCQAPRGVGGIPKLFHCPTCSKGYIELTAEYSVKYTDKENKEQEMSESWLVASVELTAEQVALFKEHLPKEGDVPPTEEDDEEKEE